MDLRHRSDVAACYVYTKYIFYLQENGGPEKFLRHWFQLLGLRQWRCICSNITSNSPNFSWVSPWMWAEEGKNCLNFLVPVAAAAAATQQMVVRDRDSEVGPAPPPPPPPPPPPTTQISQRNRLGYWSSWCWTWCTGKDDDTWLLSVTSPQSWNNGDVTKWWQNIRGTPTQPLSLMSQHSHILAHLLTLLSSGDYRCFPPLSHTKWLLTLQMVFHQIKNFTKHQHWEMNKSNCLLNVVKLA